MRAASSRPPTRPASSCRRSRSTTTRPRSRRPATTSRTRTRRRACWRVSATRGQPAEAHDHHDHRLHRLGRLARRGQAAAEAGRHRPDRRRPRVSRPSTTGSTTATSTSPTTARRGGPTPYYELRQMLYSKNSAPIGKPASSNYERYANPARSTRCSTSTRRRTRPARSRSSRRSARRCCKDIPIIPTTESRQLVPVQHRRHRRLADTERPVRAAGGIQRPGRRAGAAAPLLEVGAELVGSTTAGPPSRVGPGRWTR